MVRPTRSNGRLREDPPEQEQSGINRSVLAAGAFLALVVVFAVIVFTRGDKTPPASAPSPGSQEPTEADAALDGRIPTGPPLVRWELYRTVALPYSDAAGPARVQGAVATGFARTPTGALLASVHAGYRLTLAFDSEWQAVAASMIQPGTGLQARARIRAQVQVNEAPSPGTILQMAGFRFVTYTADVAVIQNATRAANGALQMTTSTVVWSGGDWKLVLQPDGSESPTAQHLSSLDGFVAWGGI